MKLDPVVAKVQLQLDMPQITATLKELEKMASKALNVQVKIDATTNTQAVKDQISGLQQTISKVGKVNIDYSFDEAKLRSDLNT